MPAGRQLPAVTKNRNYPQPVKHLKPAALGLSVFVAFFIGTIEILGLISQEYNLTGGFWSFMANFDINKAGFIIVGIFALTWAVALSVWHFGHIEQRWDVAAAKANASD